jgi:DNA-binding transcriptional LysR family regulator
MAITVTQLTAFLAVVRGGSVTAAADELVVTQPSVSAALAALGRELNCELFERAGRGIRLTAAGGAFAPYAADVLGLLEQGRTAAREASAVAARRLEIAAVTTAAESFVPGMMRRFAEQHPDIELTLVVGNRHDVFERVSSHAADVAITGRPPGDDRLLAQPFMNNEIVCITAPDDPLAASGPVGAERLADRCWLLREPGSGTRAVGEQFLAEHGLEARAGLGLSLLSKAAVETELGAGWLGELQLADAPAARPWFLLRSATGPVRPVVELFTSFVMEQARR